MNGQQQARLMEFMTIKDVEEGLRVTQTVILPVGCVEQHGWHLPLSTDMFNATELSKAVAEKTGCFVAPLMPYSYSGGTLLGTINIAPATVSAVINDICSSLAQQGFKNIIVFLGHGGSENVRGIRDGLDIAIRSNPALAAVAVALAPFTDMSPTIASWFEKKDFHAAAFETSLMLYWRPDLVREPWVTDAPEVMAMLRADQDAYQRVERPVDHPLVMPRISQHERIKIGVLGDPLQASASCGEQMAAEVVENMVALINKMEAAQG